MTFLDDSTSRPLFNSNRVAVIRNQILIGTLIGASVSNKMNAFLKLLTDSHLNHQFINVLYGGRGGGGSFTKGVLSNRRSSKHIIVSNMKQYKNDENNPVHNEVVIKANLIQIYHT